VPYPDVARLVSLDNPSFGRTEAVLALQVREDLNWDFLYLYNFSNISSAGILIKHFYCYSSFQSHVCEYFNFRSSNFKINLNKNSAKYLQEHQFFAMNSLQEI
jgi:hypothetical protein